MQMLMIKRAIWLCIALDQIARFIINICIMKRKKVLQTAVR